MKKISLSIVALLFAGASIMAIGHTPVKKVKQVTCTNCPNGKCTKANCPKPANCADKAHCTGM